ncbi:hypothetical protein AB0C61_33350 [Streptomyces sp. NPDC048680]|uniref:hypothetical protein n=1 Tax=Streptomyces sp. NPDC048680 TaxID=3155492 RepID=UPI003427B51A
MLYWRLETSPRPAAVHAAYGLARTPDHCLNPVRIVPGAVRKLRHIREQAGHTGELALCANRAGKVLPHGGVAVPKVAQRVFGGFAECRLGDLVEFGALCRMEILDEPGDILRTPAQCERGVQFPEKFFDGGRQHEPHLVIPRSSAQLDIRGPQSRVIPQRCWRDCLPDAGLRQIDSLFGTEKPTTELEERRRKPITVRLALSTSHGLRISPLTWNERSWKPTLVAAEVLRQVGESIRVQGCEGPATVPRTRADRFSPAVSGAAS